MATFYSEQKSFRAQDKIDKQTETLFLSTRIDIRGNHLKGPVQVSIKYKAIFRLDEEFQTVNEEDGEYNGETISREFLTSDEREMYIRKNYKLNVEQVS